MIVLPKETPFLSNLNSYYVQIERLIEHFQGEVGCGALHFYSLSSEGILFFDKDEILNGLFSQQESEVLGKVAVESLITSSATTNFSLNAYNGRISGGSHSWGRGDIKRGDSDRNRLIQLSKEHGGSFHVSRITIEENDNVTNDDIDLEPEELSEKPSARIVTAMEEMLAIFERTVANMKTTDSDFATLLNRKFVEKADHYPFLDPFAAEFRYSNEKIFFEGDTTDAELTRGIVESVTELAEELGASQQFKNNLITWMKKYKEEAQDYDITI